MILTLKEAPSLLSQAGWGLILLYEGKKHSGGCRLRRIHEIGGTGDLHHDGAMADQLHAETGQKLIVMLLTADEEAQMKALAHDDATAAPAMNAIPHRQKNLPVFLLRSTI